MIQKIKTKYNEHWLIDSKKIFQNIIVGDAVRLSRTKSDDYFFINGVQLINIDNIESYEPVPNNELLFFEYVKAMKEVPNRKFIVNDFDVNKYLLD